MSDKLLHVLNFTHRATLGGGDDKDGERGDLHPVAQQQLDRLKQRYSTVFSDPTYPIDRSDAPLQFEHRIPLKDESAEPPKRKLYPLDARELEELKEQLRKFLDSG